MTVVKRLGRLAFAAAVFLAAATLAISENTDDTAPQPIALLADIAGPIGPATTRHVERVIKIAAAQQAEVLILRLDTPGGLVDAMRDIIKEILASPTPVVGYVAPPGAHAASAGTYILYATHVAAMAPGTNLGAATPVSIGGLPGTPPARPSPLGEKQDETGNGDNDESSDDGGGQPTTLAPEDAMTAKATNDAVAFIRSLAELRGRNADWAERAVREAASLSSARALDAGVIELVVANNDDLLSALDGRTVSVGGEERVLATSDLVITRIEMDSVTRILAVLSNPNLALILMMIGVYGIILEFWSPGALVPGVVGAISLMLGLYALNMLPLDYAGLALIGLGVAFMVAEAFTPTFGILGFGGLIAFVTGAAMLIDTDVPAFQISWWVIGTMATASAGVLVLLLGYTLRVYGSRPTAGHSRMLGKEALVLDWSGEDGFVWAEGERWHAQGVTDLAPGATVQIRAVAGLTLLVETSSQASGQADVGQRKGETSP